MIRPIHFGYYMDAHVAVIVVMFRAGPKKSKKQVVLIEWPQATRVGWPRPRREWGMVWRGGVPRKFVYTFPLKMVHFGAF